jgi:hypothetical protein
LSERSARQERPPSPAPDRQLKLLEGMASIMGDLDQGGLGAEQLEHGPLGTTGQPPARRRQFDDIEDLYSLTGQWRRRSRARLAAGRYLLHAPPVAIRVAEEDEPDVVEWVGLRSGVLAHDLDLADLHPTLRELSTCRLDIGND